MPGADSLLLRDVVILYIAELAEQLVESHVLLLVPVGVQRFNGLNLLWVDFEVLATVHGRNWVDEAALVVVVGA